MKKVLQLMQPFALVLALAGALALAIPGPRPAYGQPAPGSLENIECTMLPSAARTTTAAVPSAVFTNGHWRGAHVIINVSAYTSGNFTPTIQGRDPTSGNFYTILAGTAISSATTAVLKVYPGLVAGANVANDILPTKWRVSVLGAGGPSATYSVSCSLIN